MTPGVLDTSTVILLGRLRAEDLPDECLISAITLAELSAGPLVTSDPAEAAARQRHAQQAEADFVVLAFDAAAARTFSSVAASLRASGTKPRTRAYDALIAATAMANGLPVFTCNPHDFTGVDGLDLRPVPHPDH